MAKTKSAPTAPRHKGFDMTKLLLIFAPLLLPGFSLAESRTVYQMDGNGLKSDQEVEEYQAEKRKKCKYETPKTFQGSVLW